MRSKTTPESIREAYRRVKRRAGYRGRPNPDTLSVTSGTVRDRLWQLGLGDARTRTRSPVASVTVGERRRRLGLGTLGQGPGTATLRATWRPPFHPEVRFWCM